MSSDLPNVIRMSSNCTIIHQDVLKLHHTSSGCPQTAPSFIRMSSNTILHQDVLKHHTSSRYPQTAPSFIRISSNCTILHQDVLKHHTSSGCPQTPYFIRISSNCTIIHQDVLKLHHHSSGCPQTPSFIRMSSNTILHQDVLELHHHSSGCTQTAICFPMTPIWCTLSMLYNTIIDKIWITKHRINCDNRVFHFPDYTETCRTILNKPEISLRLFCITLLIVCGCISE